MKTRLALVVVAFVGLAVVGVVLSRDGDSGASTNASGARLASEQERPLAAVLAPDSSAPVADIAEGFPENKGARVAEALPDGTKVLALHGTAEDSSKACVFALSDTKPRSMLGSCGSVAHFNEAGVLAIIGADPIERLVGLVPDGVDTVTLRLEDGTSESVKVHNNAYSFSPTRTPDVLSFTGTRELAPRTLD